MWLATVLVYQANEPNCIFLMDEQFQKDILLKLISLPSGENKCTLLPGKEYGMSFAMGWV